MKLETDEDTEANLIIASNSTTTHELLEYCLQAKLKSYTNLKK
jgi:hypothetical protein